MAVETTLTASPDVVALVRARAKETHRDPQAIVDEILRDALGSSATAQPLAGVDLSRKGAIYEALRQSPLVGADLDLVREIEPGREIDL